MKVEWSYLSPRMPELFGVTDEELRRDPRATKQRMVPEDSARLDELHRASLQTLAPLSWTGRLVLASGAIRWIEQQTVFERAGDGAVLAYGQVLDVTAQ